MKRYCAGMAIVGVLLMIFDAAIAIFSLSYSTGSRLQNTIQYVFSSYGLFGFGLFLVIFSTGAYIELIEQEKTRLLNSLL